MGDNGKEGRVAEAERKGGGEEGRKKVGRPKKIEELGKERRSSTGCIEEFLKRKREESGEDDFDEEGRGMRRSKKLENLQEEGKGVDKEEIGKMIKEMGERMMERFCEELRDLKLELWQREKEWRDERRDLGLKIESMEKKILELEARVGERGGAVEGVGGREAGGRIELDKETVEEMKGIGRKLELKEREERRNNIVIRRLEGGTEDLKRRVEKVLEVIGAKVGIEWIKKIRGKEGGEGEMVVVRLGNREQKRQVMEKKKELRGKRVRIDDDLTWGERRMKWRIGEIAEEERIKGKVWIGYGKIRINDC